MKEEDITSTLITALNLVFDTAHREVLSGGGKSDIYVEAERGDRTHKAYIGEANSGKAKPRLKNT